MALAWRHLDDTFKQQLRNKKAVHVGAPYGVKNAPPQDSQFKGSIAMDRQNPEADRETLHPLVCLHPQTNEEILFINPTYTTRIEGISEKTSYEWLTKLYQHVQRPEFACRFKWSENTIAIWDNRSTLHYAINDYDGHLRCLYRTTIQGHQPISASDENSSE